MSITVIADEKKLNQDALASRLVQKIVELELDDKILVYYNFPFFRGETNDLIQAHVLFISQKYGVIFFRCITSTDEITDDEFSYFENLDSFIYAKINKREELRIRRRELKINLTPIFYVSDLQQAESKDDIKLISINEVLETITENQKEILTDEEFDILSATVEGSQSLKNKKERFIDEEDERLTKGKILTLIQEKEAVFDIEQKRAALNIIDSPQRIRGLAGSGKTIILTMKAALYHLQNPEAEILYTYYTKALYGQVKYLIEKYYRDFSDNNEPNWNKIHILHGWGGKGLRGVYSDTCFENSIPSIDFMSAKRANGSQPLGYIFEKLNEKTLRQKYDLTLIDEGQDFPVSFYRVCRQITKESRVVWAYDDFQNIFDTKMQDEKETFGKDKEGKYFVDFSENKNNLQDIILHKCYRNPRIALISAFSLGLGIYNDRVIQRLENNRHWEDLGFEVLEGDSTTGSKMIIQRPEKNSPSLSNKYLSKDGVTVNIFSNLDEECGYVIAAIENDIRNEKLRPDDICVIGLDDRAIGGYFDNIEAGLVARGISVFNILNAPSNNTTFSIENHVTLSTINKAKGNESGMVYLVGIDSIFDNKNSIIRRNMLFTAITRSKGWVSMTGFESAKIGIRELEALQKNDYKLIFTQPSEESTKTILRGISKEQEFLNQVNRKLQDMAAELGISQEEALTLIAKSQKKKK
ncbi:ATP-binding domain-containing protein [Chitinophaga polysaccharea]|uniref:DEAD/DEAH box helicase n=1 Tax=Chitinophaga polysaccharea TaxID=1293035 RepID=UPI001455C023|nr:ATP-binding domain-containing protein [Chitinophaga polysaccharea]NLR58860.1 ATP-binding domain-containing protein [Chitinophaga polysaccharea]